MSALLFTIAGVAVRNGVGDAGFWTAIIAAIFTGVAGLYNLYLTKRTDIRQRREIVPKIEETKVKTAEIREELTGHYGRVEGAYDRMTKALEREGKRE